MDQTQWKITLDGPRLYSWPTRMSPSVSSLNFAKEFKTKKEVCITSIKSDHGGKFENENF